MAKRKKLEELVEEIAHCQKCSFYKTANQAVPGEGNPKAKIFFIGEAPGFWEDQKGRPFIGEAGQILDELLARAGLKREEVFIGNIIKHRPPQNRDPLEMEIKACRFWLLEQIKIIDPTLIVTLGRFAMEEFFPGEKISKIHGQKRTCCLEGREKVIIPMFHPAAALWNRRTLISLEEDFSKLQLVVKELIKN